MIVNHFDLVAQEFDRQPPQTGSFGSGAEPESSPLYQERLRDYFQFQQRVLARLAREFPSERWGYLQIGGDNLLDHQGVRVKVGRVCGPDGQLYKIGRDIPTANTPAWEEDGLVQNDHGGEAKNYYVPFEGAVVIDPPPPPPPIDPPVPSDLAALLHAFSADVATLKTLLQEAGSLQVLQRAEFVHDVTEVLKGLTFEGEFRRYVGSITITLKPTLKP